MGGCISAGFWDNREACEVTPESLFRTRERFSMSSALKLSWKNMLSRDCRKLAATALCGIATASLLLGLEARGEEKVIKVGVIGLDTSHAPAFVRVMNDASGKDHIPGCKVIAAYPKGSPDIESSVSRVPGYTKDLEGMGVEIVDSIDTLLTKVDAILLETNDGRPHFEQAVPVFKARKPLFIDKPVAGSLLDAIALYKASEKHQVPMFSSSSLRYSPGAQKIRSGEVGKVFGADATSPASLEATHPDLYWYGIHGVETLFTVMGPGCQSVSRTTSPDFDVAVGLWDDGRIGTFRGARKGPAPYGGMYYAEKGAGPIGDYGGYAPLVKEIVKFFQTGVAPIDPKETLEIYAFMEAADESKRQGGRPVTLESVMQAAQDAAAKRLADAGL